MNDLDYKSSLILKNNMGFQEIYTSQNYGTFYGVYLSMKCKSDPKHPEIIEISNLTFELINYKGLFNLGIVDIDYSFEKEEVKNEKQEVISSREYLKFSIDVRAMQRKRKFYLIDESGSPVVISINTKKIKDALISRNLLPMQEFNTNLNPNDPDNTIFDNEFYYRDGLEFPVKDRQRLNWDGMNGVGGSSSGKRCYQVEIRLLT